MPAIRCCATVARTTGHREGYRNELAEVIRAIVRDGLATHGAAILAGTPNSVSQEDKQKFIILVQTELKTLHAGNDIRFGLLPLEFSLWQEKGTKFCD
ncbi:hypothetical protein [Methylomonas sp. UP202]|uniref:hypothetical protein n=1 Tax=Methylomonas sp. UP202 TaxID=3040943 RepID=UPI002478EAB8|nr:hypothetical protein [Methylomonas sp. UP202]WGS85045.1 hypothetical protein QC632_18625 [Methylomonas sp. UP202]